MTELLLESNTETDSRPEDSIRNAILSMERIHDITGIYNAGAYVDQTDGKIRLLARHVTEPGEDGKPDSGPLVLMVRGRDGGIESIQEVPESVGLEDIRINSLPNGELIAGGTYVIEHDGVSIPYPVTMKLNHGMNAQPLKPRHVKTFGGGRETTPLGMNKDLDFGIPDGKNSTFINRNYFAFRPEGEENNHRLLVFKYGDEEAAHFVQDIHLPRLPYMEHRAGTTFSPIFLNKNEAIFPVHGSKLVDGKYIYSIGSARLLHNNGGTFTIDNISQESLLNPDSFMNLFAEDEQVELHPDKRRAIYCCGGVVSPENPDELIAFVSVGDLHMVEVTLSIPLIVSHWQNSRAKNELSTEF